MTWFDFVLEVCRSFGCACYEFTLSLFSCCVGNGAGDDSDLCSVNSCHRSPLLVGSDVPFCRAHTRTYPLCRSTLSSPLLCLVQVWAVRTVCLRTVGGIC